jgi:hypothetical protein
VDVMEENGNVPTRIDGCGGDVVGDEFVTYSLDRAVAGVVVYRPLEWRGEVGVCCHGVLPPTTIMVSLHDLGTRLSCLTLRLSRAWKPERSVGCKASAAAGC